MPASRETWTLLALMHPEGLTPNAAADAWNFEAGVVLPLAAFAALYAAGLARLWGAAGIGAGIERWRALSFAGGWAAMVLALMSPIDALSDELSSVHMIQHELLMIAAAPLLVAGLPLIVALYALPWRARQAVAAHVRRRHVRSVWAAVTAPVAVWLLHAAAVWLWHLPPLYQAALADARLHALEHASFFGTAMLFWWGMMRGRYGRMGYGVSVVYVFATALHTGLLGAALTISPALWYGAYAATTARWGLTPLEDQQLAGLIMWVPAGLVFTTVGLVYFAAWLRESERRVRILQRPDRSLAR
jgi:cytochrome c oxidase assembly factor CtaG